MKKKSKRSLIFLLILLTIVVILNTTYIIRIPFSNTRIPSYFLFGHIGQEDIDSSLSPDGKYYFGTNLIHRLDTFSIPQIINIDAHYMSKVTWSPDSTAFTVYAADQSGKCLDNQIFLVDLADETHPKLRKYKFDFYTCGSVYWSPDSSQFLIHHGKKFLLFDRYDQENFIPSYHFVDVFCNDLTWTENRIICQAYDSEQMELVYLDPISFSPTNRSIPTWRLLSLSPDGKYFLSKSIHDEYIADIYHYEIWEIETGKLIKSIPVVWKFWDCSPIQNEGKAVFIGNPSHGDLYDNHLYIFDWNTMDFTDYGKSTWAAGWRSEMDGALSINYVFWVFGTTPYVTVKIVP